MKKNLLSVIAAIAFVLLFAMPFSAKANHSAGGELLYEWISDSTYRFYLKFFRDCKGIEAYDSVYVCYRNTCDSANANNLMLRKMITLPDGTPNGKEVNPGCPGVKTRCSYPNSGTNPTIPPGTLPGYQEWWYTGVVTLPRRCNAWTFVVSVNARNGSNNIGTTIDNLYIEATLNNLDVPEQSSPYFTVKPVPYVCINQPVAYSIGPVDPNGDSLSFEFQIPRSGGNANLGTGGAGPTLSNTGPKCPAYPILLQYISPFSIANPFSTSNTFRFNTVSSEMTFTPDMISVNTVSVLVTKWRYGIKIGSVMRDVQFNVIACTNAPIALQVDTLKLFNSFYENRVIEACVDRPMGFRYKITTPTKGAILVATDNHDRSTPGAGVLYINNFTDSIIGAFSWTPHDTGMFYLTVTVRDSTCRAPGVMVPQSYIIPIHIRAWWSGVSKIKHCISDKLVLTSNGDDQIHWDVLPGGSPASSIECPSCKSTVVRPMVNTTYICTYTASKSCATGDTITVIVTKNEVKIKPDGPFAWCSGQWLSLEATASGPLPQINMPCGPTILTPHTLLDTISIAPWAPPRPTPAGMQSSANPGSSPFNGNYRTAHHQYLLKAKELRSAGIYSGTIKSISFRLANAPVGAVFKNVKISLACTEDTLNTDTTFIGGLTQVFAANNVPLSSGNNYVKFDLTTLYSWDTTKDLLIDMCYANTSAVAPVNTFYWNTGYNATKYVYSLSGDACNGAIVVGGKGILLKQVPAMRFEMYEAPETTFSYKWTGSVFSPSDAVAQVTTFVDRTSKIIITTDGINGCKPTDTVDVYIPLHGYKIKKDTVICIGASAQLWIVDTASEGTAPSSYEWHEGDINNSAPSLICSNCADPIATPSTDTRYWVVAKDSINCGDTLNVFVKVNPLPVVTITTPDTVIGLGETIQLNATGANTYAWFPLSTLNNGYIPNPVAKPDDTTVYTVIGMSNGCEGRDTVKIKVDKKGLIFVPDAFTPNGDGLNDEFRIVNLTFQKVLEFRVFSRWGQEVFYTSNTKKGWDGTYKGVPQELGTYCYLIRVGMPTGEVRTYKGNVTLIR